MSGSFPVVCMRGAGDSLVVDPSKSLGDASLAELFDVRTAGLPHFKYQRREFASKASDLSRSFLDPTYGGECSLKSLAPADRDEVLHSFLCMCRCCVITCPFTLIADCGHARGHQLILVTELVSVSQFQLKHVHVQLMNIAG